MTFNMIWSPRIGVMGLNLFMSLRHTSRPFSPTNLEIVSDGPLQVVDQHVVHHRGPDRAVVSVQLSDPVSSDLVGLHLGPLDQQVELWIDLLHGAPKLEGEFLPLLLVSVNAHGTSFVQVPGSV